ncbi:hypothetical protein ACIHCX_37600 [Streptomyces sp. NPDC052043]|uniref:hypothetical protein n=1 Tax=Streptomyces sp. NPDC052043 TaxID=3365684 RepID=UPI0037D24640
MQVHSCQRSHPKEIRTAAGSALCIDCNRQVEYHLRALPELHQESLNNVSSSTRRTNPTKVSGSRRHDFVDTSVIDTRHHTLAMLEAWAANVSKELGIPVPVRTVPHLTRFLAGHLKWLTAQPRATEFADAMERLAGGLRHIIDPGPNPMKALIRQCVVDNCTGTINVSPISGEKASDTSIGCSAGHSWKMHEWLTLRQLLERQRKGVSA